MHLLATARYLHGGQTAVEMNKLTCVDVEQSEGSNFLNMLKRLSCNYLLFSLVSSGYPLTPRTPVDIVAAAASFPLWSSG